MSAATTPELDSVEKYTQGWAVLRAEAIRKELEGVVAKRKAKNRRIAIALAGAAVTFIVLQCVTIYFRG
jgi:hypothetical protein